MMNIYLFELFLRVVQGDIGDTGKGEGDLRNWVRSFPLLLLSGCVFVCMHVCVRVCVCAYIIVDFRCLVR